MKLTDWYPGDVKPVRIGVYERKHLFRGHCYIFKDRWNGSRWTYPHGNYMADESQSLPWRGLAEEPK